MRTTPVIGIIKKKEFFWVTIDYAYQLTHLKKIVSLLYENSAVISYNGEIYNYLDIKRKYKYIFNNFKTTGDTELLIKFWKLKKSEIFNELDGMFAFSIFDNDILTLAVDFFG